MHRASFLRILGCLALLSLTACWGRGVGVASLPPGGTTLSASPFFPMDLGEFSGQALTRLSCPEWRSESDAEKSELVCEQYEFRGLKGRMTLRFSRDRLWFGRWELRKRWDLAELRDVTQVLARELRGHFGKPFFSNVDEDWDYALLHGEFHERWLLDTWGERMAYFWVGLHEPEPGSAEAALPLAERERTLAVQIRTRTIPGR
jgi:hypothetical protein